MKAIPYNKDFVIFGNPDTGEVHGFEFDNQKPTDLQKIEFAEEIEFVENLKKPVKWTFWVKDFHGLLGPVIEATSKKAWKFWVALKGGIEVLKGIASNVKIERVDGDAIEISFDWTKQLEQKNEHSNSNRYG